MELSFSVGWVRALVAVAAVDLLSVVVSVVAVLAFALLADGGQTATDGGGLVGRFAEQIAI